MNQLESSVQQRRVGYLCFTINKYELGKGPKREKGLSVPGERNNVNYYSMVRMLYQLLSQHI